jgi:uncharacterized Tic20 family protein
MGQPSGNYSNSGGYTSAGSNSNQLAMWSHLGGLFFGFIPALVIRSTDAARRDPYVFAQATEALNFQLHWLIVSIGSVVFGSILTAVTFGIGGLIFIPLFLAIGVAVLIFPILAAVATSRGDSYRYPMMFFRLVK